MRRALIFAVLLFTAGILPAATLSIDNSCDISVSPAATLLLPYFEVETNKEVSTAANTIFTVVNTSAQPQLARVTVWTDYGYPITWFTLFLTGYDAKSISLYDLIVAGKSPATDPKFASGSKSAPNDSNPRLTLQTCGTPSIVPAFITNPMKTALTAGTLTGANCPVGGTHAMATGYVTIDVVTACTGTSPLDPVYYSQIIGYDNVLTGDYEHVYPDRTTGNFAGGSPLIHIKAIPGGGNANVTTQLPYTFYDRYTPNGGRRVDRRQPLPSVFASRFIQGGPTAFTTDFVFWREGVGSAVSDVCNAVSSATMPLTTVVRFDEFENPTIAASSIRTPITSSLSTTSAVMPPLSGQSLTGWMYIDLDNRGDVAAASQSTSRGYSNPNRSSQNWVVVRMRAEGRYGVDYDASALRNACTAPVAATKAPAVGVAK